MCTCNNCASISLLSPNNPETPAIYIPQKYGHCIWYFKTPITKCSECYNGNWLQIHEYIWTKLHTNNFAAWLLLIDNCEGPVSWYSSYYLISQESLMMAESNFHLFMCSHVSLCKGSHFFLIQRGDSIDSYRNHAYSDWEVIHSTENGNVRIYMQHLHILH